MPNPLPYSGFGTRWGYDAHLVHNHRVQVGLKLVLLRVKHCLLFISHEIVQVQGALLRDEGAEEGK